MANELILVVDDDKDLREFTISCLEEEGFRTISSENGKDAIEKSTTEGLGLILLVSVPLWSNQGLKPTSVTGSILSELK